jgi:DNA-directed RNA polymerase subunit H (RpoH/RPB5)
MWGDNLKKILKEYKLYKGQLVIIDYSDIVRLIGRISKLYTG